MTEQELKEIFKLLEEQGWKPMLCDTPVPFYDSEVPCGPPNGVGDVVCEIAMMPRGEHVAQLIKSGFLWDSRRVNAKAKN